MKDRGHSLRILLATFLYLNKVDVADIKNLMPHANVNTTINCYIDPDSERLNEIMDNIGTF